MKGDISLNPWWAESLLLGHGMTVEEIFERSAALGIDGVDIQESYLGLDPYPDPLRIRALRRTLAGLHLEAISCWFYCDLLGGARVASVDAVIEVVRRYLAIAAELSSRYLVLANGHTPPGRRPEAGRDTLMRIYEGIAPGADDADVVVCFEAARAGSRFNSPKGALTLVKEFGHPRLQMAPDFEAWRRPSQAMPASYAENPGARQALPLSVEDFRECLPYSPYVHAKFLEFDQDGDDHNFPTADLLAAVRDDDYAHDLSVEYEGWLPEVHPERDPEIETAKAVALVRRLAG